uniref:FBX36 n=1 Tax=Poeciliopsis prolifica TaxID=188132 RepID=A0A0S7EKK2_9TELE
MASLLTDPLFETCGRGPPPIKDYYHFFVTKSEIIWRWWKISPRTVDRHSKPGEVKESLSDFLEDPDLQSKATTSRDLSKHSQWKQMSRLTAKHKREKAKLVRGVG